MAALIVAPCCLSQAVGNRPPAIEVSVGYLAQFSNSPPGACGCFVLQGGYADVGLPVHGRFQAVLELDGVTAGSVPEASRGLSVVTLAVGPKFRQPVGSRLSIFGQALLGAARGFDAEFIGSGPGRDTATSFALLAGGGVDFALGRRLSLRPVRVDLISTRLANGSDNAQRNVRIGGGIVFHLSDLKLRR